MNSSTVIDRSGYSQLRCKIAAFFWDALLTLILICIMPSYIYNSKVMSYLH